MEESEVTVKIRSKLTDGTLPREKCQITWFGPGTGKPCDACGRFVTAADIECECDHPNGAVIRFHKLCFAVWDEERKEPDR
jgi:hypothetical protein